jgi:hypothetical protein
MKGCRSSRKGAVMTREVITVGAGAAIGREVEDVLRRRLWIQPDQVRVRMDRGTAVLTGEVGFDDADLARSKIDRTHPFSAEPFRPGGRRRRNPLRPTIGRWRTPRRHRAAAGTD